MNLVPRLNAPARRAAEGFVDPEVAETPPARRRPRFARVGLAAGAVASIAVASLMISNAAANSSAVTPLESTAVASPGTVAVFESRGSDVSRTAEDRTAVDQAATVRGQSIQAENDAVAQAAQLSVLQSRSSSMTEASDAITAQAKKLANKKNFLIPTAGALGSPFGMRLHPILHYWRMHDGDDIGGACGQPIYATQDGVVIKTESGYNGGSGNNVEIEHGQIGSVDVRSDYFHMNKFIVQVGQTVRRGDLIGYVGDTGLSTACHLHFQVRENTVPVDPIGNGYIKSPSADAAPTTEG